MQNQSSQHFDPEQPFEASASENTTIVISVENSPQKQFENDQQDRQIGSEEKSKQKPEIDGQGIQDAPKQQIMAGDNEELTFQNHQNKEKIPEQTTTVVEGQEPVRNEAENKQQILSNQGQIIQEQNQIQAVISPLNQLQLADETNPPQQSHQQPPVQQMISQPEGFEPQANIIEQQPQPSEVSHIYANQEVIEEWRDEQIAFNENKTQLSDFTFKRLDYNFVGLNDNTEQNIDRTYKGTNEVQIEKVQIEQVQENNEQGNLVVRSQIKQQQRQSDKQVTQKSAPEFASRQSKAEDMSAQVKQPQRNQVVVKQESSPITQSRQEEEHQNRPETKLNAVEPKTKEEPPKLKIIQKEESEVMKILKKYQQKNSSLKETQIKSVPQKTQQQKAQPQKQGKIERQQRKERVSAVILPTQIKKEVKKSRDKQQKQVRKQSSKKGRAGNEVVVEKQVRIQKQKQKTDGQKAAKPQQQPIKSQQTKQVEPPLPSRIIINSTAENSKQQNTTHVPAKQQTTKNILKSEQQPKRRVQQQPQRKLAQQPQKKLENQNLSQLRYRSVQIKQNEDSFTHQQQQLIQEKPKQSNVLLLLNKKQEEHAIQKQQQPQLPVKQQQNQVVAKKKKKKKKSPTDSKKPIPNKQDRPLSQRQTDQKQKDSKLPNTDTSLTHLEFDKKRIPSESDFDRKSHISQLPEQLDPSEPSHPQERMLVNSIKLQLQSKPQPQPNLPPVTSLFIVKQAEKQRVGTTYKMFLKYTFEYQRTIQNYKRIILNVSSQLSNNKNKKRGLQRLLQEYFQQSSTINRAFLDQCSKTDAETRPPIPSNNKLGNIGLQLKKGFEQMVYLRRSVANNAQRVSTYITSVVLPHLSKAFEAYYGQIAQEEGRQLHRREEHARKEKELRRVMGQVDKNFIRGLEGKGRAKDDLFIEITRFINEEKVHRACLGRYGRGLVDLRHLYIKSEKELFDRLQEILEKFKQEAQSTYSFRRGEFEELVDYTESIKGVTRFAELCTLTDLDYIRYVLEIQSKQETNRFTSRHFESYLDLIFFDRVVGSIRDMLKGAANKVFPLENGEELVHTISGNLVEFTRSQDLCRDKYQISNLDARIIGAGTVEFDELLKGIIFDDHRTRRIKLRDDDRAEELICYLNEKEEEIVVDHPVRQTY